MKKAHSRNSYLTFEGKSFIFKCVINLYKRSVVENYTLFSGLGESLVFQQISSNNSKHIIADRLTLGLTLIIAARRIG